jgi:N-acetylglucosamine-6-sulfatase
MRTSLPATLLLLLASATASHAAPNIVVIMTDDQEDTGSMAYMPKTHALLAEKGLTFTNSFVNLPLCAPSRASFLTGQSAHTTGIKANNPVDGGGWGGFKEEEENALPVWLKKAGYKTALLGKYLNRYGLESKFGSLLSWASSYLNINFTGAQVGNSEDWVPPGWDLWYAFTSVRPRYYDYAINENDAIRKFGTAPSDYSTDVLRDRAVRFIDQQRAAQDPFFMLIATKAVHSQGKCAIPAPRHADAFKDVSIPSGSALDEGKKGRTADKEATIHGESKDQLEACYRAELQSLQSVDDLVEAVVNALQRAGKLDDTVVVYTSDNGFLFGEHGMIGKAAAYEEAIKVPLVIRGPGIPEKEVRTELVNNLDVTATIADLAKASPGFELDGRSLVPLFADAKAPWRSAILIESPVSRLEKPARRFTGIRTATRKYVKFDNGKEALFDLTADPRELKNVAANAGYAGDLVSLRSLNGRLKTCAGASCWVP